MSITDAVSESRRVMDDAAAATPAKVAAARAALNDALSTVSVRARDLVSGVQTRARDQIDRRRSLTADRLESLAGALRPADQSPRARRTALAVAGGSGLVLIAVLGVGVALGWQMKKQAERRAALARRQTEAAREAKETPLLAPVNEPAAVNAGLSH